MSDKSLVFVEYSPMTQSSLQLCDCINAILCLRLIDVFLTHYEIGTALYFMVDREEKSSLYVTLR